MSNTKGQQAIPYDLRQHGDVYRVVKDECWQHERFESDRAWCWQIPCHYGHIYIHGTNRLGAYAKGTQISAQLKRLPGVTPHQVGSGEASVTFAPEMLLAVAELLGARRRRHMTPEARVAATARLAQIRASKQPREGSARAQDARGGSK